VEAQNITWHKGKKNLPDKLGYAVANTLSCFARLASYLAVTDDYKCLPEEGGFNFKMGTDLVIFYTWGTISGPTWLELKQSACCGAACQKWHVA